MNTRLTSIAIFLLLLLCAVLPASGGSHGDLHVTGVSGASIYLDGELMGVTSDDGLLIEEVLAADYELRAEVKGKVIFSATVTVELDDIVSVSIGIE